MEKTKFCINCGQAIAESAKFCSTCGKDQYSSHNPSGPENYSNKKSFNDEWLITLLLVWFFGVVGGHRFYHGRITSGIFMILTLGGVFIWYFIDIIMVLSGNFKNAEGEKIPARL